MHVMSDNVYLETVQRGSDKELCVTTLRNHVMPLVRFNIEDKGEILRNVSCKCGRCGDILKLHMGEVMNGFKMRMEHRCTHTL